MLGVIKGHNSNEYAVVISLHRNDLLECGINKEVISKIDDELLSEIAEKTGDSLVELGFWEVLRTVVDECVELPTEGDDSEADEEDVEEETKREVFTVECEGGSLVADSLTGDVVIRGVRNEYIMPLIIMLDNEEWMEYYNKDSISGEVIDISDIGYWLSDLSYVEANEDFRMDFKA